MSEIMKIWDKGAQAYDEGLQGIRTYHRSHEAVVDFLYYLPRKGAIRILDFECKDAEFFSQIMWRIRPVAPPPSKEMMDLKEDTKAISHCGEESLLQLLPLREHLRLMTAAGLKSNCVWQYLFQALLMGIKSPENGFGVSV